MNEETFGDLRQLQAIVEETIGRVRQFMSRQHDYLVHQPELEDAIILLKRGVEQTAEILAACR